MRKLVFIILFAIFLCACNQSNKELSEVDISIPSDTGSTVHAMPDDMPKDFGFSIQFGVGKKNEINTFKGTVTKDLIEDGIATADVTLLEEEMTEIYEKMKEDNIIGTKKLVPEPINGTTCAQEPFQEDEWKITINSETITQSVSGTYCEPTDDAKQLLELRNFVFNIIRTKEEYMKLPESKGGYE